MIDIKCLDSSAWLSYYFAENIEVRDIVESSAAIIISPISLFEIKKRLIKLKKDYKSFLEFIKKRSSILVPGAMIAEKAAEISVEKGLGAVDSIIYTTALVGNAELITGDNDFRDLNNVKIIA